MTIFRKVSMLIMVAIIAITSISSTSFAATKSNIEFDQYPDYELIDVTYDEEGRRTETYEFDLAENAITEDNGILLLSVNQTFTFTGTHRGADRTYSGNYLQYTIKITDSNGNSVDNTVLVELYDYNHTNPLSSTSVSANGSSTVVSGISITSGRTYYFYYTTTSGTSRALKVQMSITDYS